MIDIPILILGVICGFACAVWTSAAWASFKGGNPGFGVGFGVVGISTAIATITLFLRITGNPFALPPNMTVYLLMIIIGVPPLLLLRYWRKAEEAVEGVELLDT